MKARFIPQAGRYLVSVLDQEHMLEGILLPDSSKEDMQAGIVAAGEGLYKPGDRVLFGPWAGKDIQLEGIPFRVITEAEIDGSVVYEEEVLEEHGTEGA